LVKGKKKPCKWQKSPDLFRGLYEFCAFVIIAQNGPGFAEIRRFRQAGATIVVIASSRETNPTALAERRLNQSYPTLAALAEM